MLFGQSLGVDGLRKKGCVQNAVNLSQELRRSSSHLEQQNKEAPDWTFSNLGALRRILNFAQLFPEQSAQILLARILVGRCFVDLEER
jgi:hypothetical protein